MFHRLFKGFCEYKLYIILFVLIICFTLITGFNGLYGQDSYEYLRFTSALIEFAKHGVDPGKDYWPVLYPICGILFSVFFKPLLALQLISVISLVLSGIYLEKILKIAYNADIKIIRLFVFLFFLVSPYLLRASLTVMADSLCLLFITAAWYCFLKYKEEKSNLFFVGFVILAASAVATRYAAFVVIIIPAVYIAYYFFKKFSLKSFLLAGSAVSFILLPYIIIHKSSSTDFFDLWLQGWSYKNLIHSDFYTADGHQVYTFPNGIFCLFNLFHPAYCFAGVLFLAASLKTFLKNGASTVQWIFIMSLLLYAFFLAGLPFQDLRHLILSFTSVVILFFPGFKLIYNLLTNTKPGIVKPLLLVCLVIQLALFFRVFIPFYKYNKMEKQISEEVLKYNNSTLYTFSIDAAVLHYGYQGKIINMWEVKVDTFPAIHEDALLLFNEKQFSEIWKNRNPMINWYYLKAKYKLTKLSDLPDNWELYLLVH